MVFVVVIPTVLNGAGKVHGATKRPRFFDEALAESSESVPRNWELKVPELSEGDDLSLERIELLEPAVSRLPSPQTDAKSEVTESAFCEPSLERLLARAIQTSPVVASARARLEAASGAALQASLAPNPRLGYAALEVGNDSAGQFGAFVNNRIVRGNKIGLRYQVAEKEYAARQVDLCSALAKVELAVRRTYIQAVVARERSKALDDLVVLGRRTTAAIRRLVAAEEMTRTAELQSQLFVTNLGNRLIAAQLRNASSRRTLAALANLPEQDLPPLDCNRLSQLPKLDWELLARRAAASPKIDRQARVIDKAARQLNLERAQQIVDLNWQLGTFYEEGTDQVFTTVQVSRPLLVNDWNQGNIRRASAELSSARNEADTMVQQTRVALAETLREYDVQRTRVERIERQLLPVSQEGLELTQIALEAGEIGYLEALTSQQTYAMALQQYYDALDAAWQTFFQLESLFLPEPWVP